ncbi:MAG: DUF4340 domain-containing protein [Ruminococcaceae bacterium]|nr:DUF4340 domain-containing protein [Oscillospiraceae bacterium]
MKRSTGLIVLLVILALAVAFYAVAAVIAKREEANSQEPEETLIPIVDKKPEEVVSLTFESKELSVGLTLNEKGKYQLTTDEHFPVDQIIASYMIEGAALIECTRKLEGADSDPATYGLAQPSAVMTAVYSDGSAVTLKLGDYNKHADAYYCDVGDGAIYLIDADYMGAFDYTVKDLLQDDRITEPKKGLSAITTFALAFRDGSGYTYGAVTEDDEDGEGKIYWNKLIDGTPVEGDFTEEVETLYKELFDADLDEWADYNVTGAERLGAFGLAEPAVTVTVRYREEVTVTGDDGSSVTKEVEKVVGFLIGDVVPAEEDGPADSDTPETDATPDASDKEPEEEKATLRYFMPEGGKIVYLLDEADLATALGLDTEPTA